MNDVPAGGLREGSNEQNQRYHKSIEDNIFIPEAFLCSLLFTVLGIGYLLPWNAFLSAASYFNHRLCSSTSPIIQNQFEAIFGLVYNISATISLATTVMYLCYTDRKINSHSLLINEDNDTTNVDRDLNRPLLSKFFNEPHQFKAQRQQRNGIYVFMALSSYLFAFLVTISLALFPEIAGGKFFFLTVLSLIVCGGSSAVYTAEILNFASRLPPAIGVKPYVSGQALAGVITSLVKLFLNFEYKDHDDKASDCQSKGIDYSALIFFSFGSLVILGSMVSFYLLNKLPITKFYEERELFLNKSKSHQTFDEDCNNQDTHYSNFDSEARTDFSDDIYIPLVDGMTNPNEQYLMDVGDENLFGMNSDRLEMEIQGKRETGNAASCNDSIWEQILIPALTCFVVLFVTLSIFPSWTYQIQRLQSDSEPQSPGGDQGNMRDDFFFAELFFIFALFDLIGRATSDIVSLDWACNSVRQLLTASYLRAALFVPLFLLCNHRRYNNGGIPALFLSNWFPVLLTALFAYSNGLLLSLTMMAWPCRIPKGSTNEGAVILSFVCSLGLLLGSIFSFLLVKVGTGT